MIPSFRQTPVILFKQSSINLVNQYKHVRNFFGATPHLFEGYTENTEQLREAYYKRIAERFTTTKETSSVVESLLKKIFINFRQQGYIVNKNHEQLIKRKIGEKVEKVVYKAYETKLSSIFKDVLTELDTADLEAVIKDFSNYSSHQKFYSQFENQTFRVKERAFDQAFKAGREFLNSTQAKQEIRKIINEFPNNT